MENNRGQSIFLSVVGIATLLVAIVGATFAYFSLTVQGNNTASTISVTAATLGDVTYSDGNDSIVVNNAYPGWTATKTVTISIASDDANATIPYTLDLVTTNADLSASTQTANEFNYSYTGSTNGSGTASLSGSGEMPKTITGSGSNGANIASGTLKGTETHTYVITFTLVEESSAQNYLQGLTYEGKLQVHVTDGEVKRTWDTSTNNWKNYTTNP